MTPREKFATWLVDAWEWAVDHEEASLAGSLADLVAHSQEPDYPLWEVANEHELVLKLQNHVGIPEKCPVSNPWEREINYSPIISLDEKTWDRIYTALGWANRDVDSQVRGRNFWLWSNAANVIRFVVKSPVVETLDE